MFLFFEKGCAGPVCAYGKRGVSEVEVYFDDFNVEHTKSPVIQADEYYPFGLTYNSYRRENGVFNRIKFQGQEHIDDLDLDWDSFKWRNHQPDIGRFFNVDPLSEKYLYNSPYAFSENKVTSHVELEGLEAWPITFFARPSPLVETAVKTSVEVGTKLVESGSKVSEVTPKSPEGKFTLEQLENFAKGSKSEVEQLAKNGYEKNTKPLEAKDPNTGQNGTTTPDAMKNNGESTVEVKNVKQQGLTRQLRLQKEFSNKNGYNPELIINKAAKLTKPLLEAGFDIKYYTPALAPSDATKVAKPIVVKPSVIILDIIL